MQHVVGMCEINRRSAATHPGLVTESGTHTPHRLYYLKILFKFMRFIAGRLLTAARSESGLCGDFISAVAGSKMLRHCGKLSLRI